jgi:DNA primase
MRYPPHLLDEIRARLPVSRVVERRVKLKRTGREYTGLSPFKNERTPSFTVNDQKGFYHCFASGEHGDVFKFIMATEGLSFPEAVERLAAEAGVSMPPPVPVDEVKASHEERLFSAMEEACRFFQDSLSTREGTTARDYLDRRGLRAADMQAFRLGYAPDSKTALKSHLSQMGYTPGEMEESGLLIHGEDIAVPYDRFRGRLMFPILDAKRRVIAFGGRALLEGQKPKYLNSPETPLFHKGHVLFNFASAREAARAGKPVVIAEGYMDVIALTRAGFPGAVAPLGTALTVDQLRLLWAMVPLPTLCFDGDAAGQKAAHRALDLGMPYLEPGRSLQFVFLPEGRDPDDMVRGGETEALAKLVTHPVTLIDVLWSREQARHALDTPEQRAAFEARLMELAGQIEHKSLKFHYISAFRERLRNSGMTRRQFAAGRPRTGGGARSGKPAFATVSARTGSLLSSKIVQVSAPVTAAREALLTGAIIRHPWLLDEFLDEIAGLQLNDGDCRRLRDHILAVHQAEEHLDNENLLEHLSRAGYDAELERVQRTNAQDADARSAIEACKEQVLEWWHHKMMLHSKAGVPRSLQEAENDYLSEQTDENFSRLQAIVQQHEIAAS